MDVEIKSEKDWNDLNSFPNFTKWEPYQSDLQNKIEKLSKKYGIPSPDKIKYEMMIPKAVFVNVPMDMEQINLKKNKKNIIQFKKEKEKNSQNPKTRKSSDVLIKEVSPGYIYKRTPNDVQVTLSEDFWHERGPKKLQTENGGLAINIEPEVIDRLERTISKLRVEMYEIKEGHKETVNIIKSEHSVLLKKKEEYHQESIKIIEDMRQAKLQQVKENHNKEIEDMGKDHEREKAKLKEEITFLKKQFEIHKTFIGEEMERKWKDEKDDLIQEMEEKTQRLMQEQKVKMEKERNTAINQLTTLHHKRLSSIMESHQLDIDKLLKKFAKTAEEAEKLEKATAEITVLRGENETLESELSEAIEKLRKTENELTNVKVKLTGFERNFDGKVAEVSERFSDKIDGLTQENLDLRKKYLEKCEKLHELSTSINSRQTDLVADAKDLMQSVILSRTRSGVRLSETSEDQHPSMFTPKDSSMGIPKRPFSAPATTKKNLSLLSSRHRQISASQLGKSFKHINRQKSAICQHRQSSASQLFNHENLQTRERSASYVLNRQNSNLRNVQGERSLTNLLSPPVASKNRQQFCKSAGKLRLPMIQFPTSETNSSISDL